MTYLRSHPLPAADTPLADRFHALVEEGEALAREMDRALNEHRANMIAREAERQATTARLGGQK